MDQDQQNCKQEPVRILVFSASLRKDSLNTNLAKQAVAVIERNGGKADYANFADFECPTFNQDLEVNDFHPEGAIEFRKRILANDAFIIASPEYNGSMPGTLKNSIDWVSRFRPQPFNERHALLMSASPSMGGGNHGLWSLRTPLVKLGTDVYSGMFSLASAHNGFTPEGAIADESLAKRFETNLVSFMQLVEAHKHYPLIKKAWIEFLGEKTNPATDRME
ncbi:MAG: NADPH-dependent oxidoreductase [Flavobacterium sp.]|nr:MAG: NADPH-dependent oxidoreductase [Flavobacterium sp.]